MTASISKSSIPNDLIPVAEILLSHLPKAIDFSHIGVLATVIECIKRSEEENRVLCGAVADFNGMLMEMSNNTFGVLRLIQDQVLLGSSISYSSLKTYSLTVHFL